MMIKKLNLKNKGFSLIELMVVVFLIVVIGMQTIRFGSEWISEQRVTESKNAINLAYRQAKEQALRNSYNLPVSSILQFEENKVCVLSPLTTEFSCDSDEVLYQYNISADVQFPDGYDGEGCVAFNSKAMGMYSSDCEGTLNIKVIKGEASEDMQF